MEQLTALLAYSLSVYGIAWILTKSRLFLFYRSLINKLRVRSADRFYKSDHKKFLKHSFAKLRYFFTKESDYFTNCIVCTSAWISLLMLLFLEQISIINYTLPLHTVFDYIFYIGFSVATTWLIANKVGDAS
jgi:hypothetical protein